MEGLGHIVIILCIRYSSPVPDHELNAGLGCSLQGLVGLVYAPAGTVLPVDLKDLVPKTQAGQGRRRVSLHQLDKHSLRDKTFLSECKVWRERRGHWRLIVERKQHSSSRGRRQGHGQEKGVKLLTTERKDIRRRLISKEVL